MSIRNTCPCCGQYHESSGCRAKEPVMTDKKCEHDTENYWEHPSKLSNWRVHKVNDQSPNCPFCPKPKGDERMKIFKYPLELKILNEVEMPLHSVIRHVGLQNGVICLWAEVDETRDTTKETFYVIGTGHAIPSSARYYLGTVQMPPFVWHIYK